MTSQYNYKQVIVVRKDLKMGKGKLAVQVAHASVSSYIEALSINREWVEQWLREGQPKIVCKVLNIDELMQIYNAAKKENLPSVIIKDSGKTQIPPGTVTCIGIGPAPSIIIDKITKKLPLL